MAEPLQRVIATKVHSGAPAEKLRVLPEETPVALVYDGSTHAVMMATPQNLEDFALGFSLSEGTISDASEIAALDVVEHEAGIELRMWMSPGAGHRLAVRRRAMLGPTGCGLCGIESLTEALPPIGIVNSNLRVSAVEIEAAIASLAPAQKLNSEARALHAAGYWTLDRGLVALREDVGRHNALDKLAGALSRADMLASSGIVVLTSRISVELVQKAVRMFAPVLVAVSAPTALAVRVAEESGVTLVGIARDESFEIFTHPERIAAEPVRRPRPVRQSTEELIHAIC